jgi:hypothetical protein
VLSTALLFLAAGALIGPGVLGLVDPGDGAVELLADIALFTVLFTDGQRANLPALRENWRLSGRALGLGMPLTMIGVAVPAHYLVGLDWPTALLLGAILSPTDPVFASALVSRTDIPLRLRRLLNVESGLNDGLALPFVLVFLALAEHAEERDHREHGGEQGQHREVRQARGEISALVPGELGEGALDADLPRAALQRGGRLGLTVIRVGIRTGLVGDIATRRTHTFRLSHHRGPSASAPRPAYLTTTSNCQS